MIKTRKNYRKQRRVRKTHKAQKRVQKRRMRKNKRRVSRKHKRRSSKKHRRQHKSRRVYRYRGGGGQAALVGKPWNGGDPTTWGKSNHYPLHNGVYPQAGLHPSDDSVPLEQRGGGLSNIIPRDVMNLGRSVGNSFTDLYAGYRGVPPATSPLPSKDQPIDQRTKYIGGLPVDMTHRLSEADNVVASI